MDADFEDHARFGAAHGDRADQAVPHIVDGIVTVGGWVHRAHDGVVRGERIEVAGSVERAADDSVAGIDGEDGCALTRKGAAKWATAKAS